jgi:uncharacterized phage infection (PIP) family protein YhgE
MGLTLPNPQLEFEYLFGSPAAAGNQTEFSAFQAFEIPAVYRKRKEIAKLEGANSVYHINARRQDLLLEAKEVCIQIIFNQKRKNYFEERLRVNQKLVADFQRRLDQGDGTILEVNKSNLQLLQTQQSLRMVNVEIQSLMTLLTQMNGGLPDILPDTSYPAAVPLPAFEVLEQEIESVDPKRLLLEQEKRLAEMRKDASKFKSLPVFELGYRHQGILGQQFNGIHTGLTIPLWEQKHVKQFHNADMLLRELQIQDHVTEQFHEIKRLYEEADLLRTALDDYLGALDQISDPVLLDKALALGEITIIEYFVENSFYQAAYVTLLELERDYQLVMARLLKYHL